MPELPEVETIKNALECAVCNSRILSVSVRCRRFRQEIPQDFEQKTCGAKIKSFKRIAKYIIVELDNGLSLIWHMGMSGKVKILESCPPDLDKHDHVLIETDKGCLIFNDVRRFGLLTYTESAQLETHPLLQNTGLDPFDEKLDSAYLYNKFRLKKTAVKIALLDQSIISGIGNIYASEALYHAQILPMRPAMDLSRKECEKLIEAIRLVLKKAIAAGGSTLRDYRRPDGGLGYFQHEHCVYGKAGQFCPQCRQANNPSLKNKNRKEPELKNKNHKEPEFSGTSGCIQKINLGGRSTFYCANLQK